MAAVLSAEGASGGAPGLERSEGPEIVFARKRALNAPPEQRLRFLIEVGTTPARAYPATLSALFHFFI